MNECDICQRMKNWIEVSVGKLMVNKVLERLWTHLIVYFIAKLLLVVGKDMILVVCNRLSKMTYFVVTTEETSVESLAMLFKDNMWKLHGLLKSVILDREPQFTADLTKEVNRMLEIETKLSTFFYPQIDR